MIYFTTVVRFKLPKTFSTTGFLSLGEYTNYHKRLYVGKKELGDIENSLLDIMPPLYGDLEDKGECFSTKVIFLSKLRNPISDNEIIDINRVTRDVIKLVKKLVCKDVEFDDNCYTTQIDRTTGVSLFSDIQKQYQDTLNNLKDSQRDIEPLKFIVHILNTAFSSMGRLPKQSLVDIISSNWRTSSIVDKYYDAILWKVNKGLKDIPDLDFDTVTRRRFISNVFNLYVPHPSSYNEDDLFAYHVNRLYKKGLVPSPDIVVIDSNIWYINKNILIKTIETFKDMNFIIKLDSVNYRKEFRNIMFLINRIPHTSCVMIVDSKTSNVSFGRELEELEEVDVSNDPPKKGPVFISFMEDSDEDDDGDIKGSELELQTKISRPFTTVDFKIPVDIANEYIKSYCNKNKDFFTSLITRKFEPVLFDSAGESNQGITALDIDYMIYENEKKMLLEQTHSNSLKNFIKFSLTSNILNDERVIDVGESGSKLTSFKGLVDKFTSFMNVDSSDEITIKSAKDKRDKETGLDKLNKLIGLADVKKTINDIVSVVKANKLYKEHGMKEMDDYFHMVFFGNPGTAKTTVARLCADIFYREGLLKKNKFAEFTRADLIGQYVGHTAKRIQKCLEAGRGGVIFIDEAYALSTGGDKDFGKEAIDTLVAMAEDMRKDTIIILAGYEQDMKNFINSNHGLKSRIIYNVKFDNYSTDELVEILEFMAKEKGFDISQEFKDRFIESVKKHMGEKTFGNGRFVRNEFTKAIISHSARITKLENPSEYDIKTLTVDDYANDYELANVDKRVGF